MHYTLCLNRVMVCSFKVPVKMFSFIFLSQIYKYSKKDFRNLFYYNESKTKNKKKTPQTVQCLLHLLGVAILSYTYNHLYPPKGFMTYIKSFIKTW